MSDHINRRVSSLREALAKGFFVENLDFLTRECNSLAQDTNYCVSFFVLKNVFREMSSALEVRPIQIEEHKELTSRISETCKLILEKILKNEPVEVEQLDSLVRQHLRNLTLFNSGR